MIVLMLLILSFAAGTDGQTRPAVQISAVPAPSIVNSSSEVSSQPGATSQVSTTVNAKEQESAVDDSKISLKELSSYYEREAERIAEENRQLKVLYTDGLIARVELEASDRSLLAARAKVEEMHSQLAATPATAPSFPDLARSNQSWTTGSQKIDDLIRDQGKLYAVDPYLIYCVISQESSFKSAAVSPKGAQGLMQLMPATAARYGVVNPFDPVQSIKGGTHYLKDLLELFNGRVDLALAGYNAGEGTVIKYGNRIPPYAETQSYVRLISMRYLKKSGS